MFGVQSDSSSRAMLGFADHDPRMVDTPDGLLSSLLAMISFAP